MKHRFNSLDLVCSVIELQKYACHYKSKTFTGNLFILFFTELLGYVCNRFMTLTIAHIC
jgi:hypothetical protein